MNQPEKVPYPAKITTTDTNSGIMQISSLVKLVMDAHGGLNRWRSFNKVAAKVVSGGFLWGMKGVEIDDTPRSMTSEFHRQWTRTDPFGNSDWDMIYKPDCVIIKTQTGEIIAEQQNPRESFNDHVWETHWTPLQLAYFNGYSMWTYYNLPFLISEPGFEMTEIPSLIQDGLLLKGLRVQFPKNIHTHCPEQNLYFDENGLLRRHDYQVDVAGKTRAARLISEYVDVQGLQFPTKHRVFMRNDDGSLRLDKVAVTIGLFDFELN